MNYRLLYFSVHETLAPRCSQQWFNEALIHLKRGDVDAWRVAMYGS